MCSQNRGMRIKMINDNPWTNDRAQRTIGTSCMFMLIAYIIISMLCVFGGIMYLAIIGIQQLVTL
jgi:hypothetical protein